MKRRKFFSLSFGGMLAAFLAPLVNIRTHESRKLSGEQRDFPFKLEAAEQSLPSGFSLYRSPRGRMIFTNLDPTTGTPTSRDTVYLKCPYWDGDKQMHFSSEVRREWSLEQIKEEFRQAVAQAHITGADWVKYRCSTLDEPLPV